jgi:hypothetical protein
MYVDINLVAPFDPVLVQGNSYSTVRGTLEVGQARMSHHSAHQGSSFDDLSLRIRSPSLTPDLAPLPTSDLALVFQLVCC